MTNGHGVQIELLRDTFIKPRTNSKLQTKTKNQCDQSNVLCDCMGL